MIALPNFNLTTWAGITAALALLGGFWRQFLNIIKRLMDLIVCRAVIKDEAARAFMSFAWRNGKKSPFGLRLFAGIQSFVSPKKRVEVVAYEGITSEPVLFWFKRRPVLVGLFNNSGKESSNIGDWNGESTFTVRYFRGTLDFDEVLQRAITEYNQARQSRQDSTKKKKRFNVFRMHGTSAGYKGEKDGEPSKTSGNAVFGGLSNTNDILTRLHQNEYRLLTWKPEDLIECSSDTAPFLNHPVAPEVLAQFDEIDIFLKYEDWFRSKGIPWRRGYCLYGDTGTGKSTIIRNIAMKYDLPIYGFDLSTYDNRSFSTDWKTVMQNAPAIALIEDLDVVFKGRENILAKDKNRDYLTFDCLLNTISGVGSSDGVLLFVTTNHVETLDPALGAPKNGDSKSTRPGRIDRSIHVGNMGVNERRKLAEILLGEWPEIINDVVSAGDGETAAQFQERCAQLAIQYFWEKGVTSEAVGIKVEKWKEDQGQGFQVVRNSSGNTCSAYRSGNRLESIMMDSSRDGE